MLVIRLLNSLSLGDDSIDIFTSPESQGGGSKRSSLDSTAYDVGIATVGDSAYIVSNTNMYAVDSKGLVIKSPLPTAMVATEGVVPAAHLPQNGASVGPIACYYGHPSTLYCYHTIQKQWTTLPCSTPHQSGAVLAMNGTIWVAGGFDPSSSKTEPTSVIDIFSFSAAELKY